MSDAVEFGIGGNNKGFVAVLNDSEKKAKESGERVKKNLDKGTEVKGSKGVGDLAKDLGKVKSAGDAAGLVLSKLGAGLRVGGIVAGVGLITKAVSDASQEMLAMQLAMERINRSNTGGTAGRTQSDLQQNLDIIREARAKNQEVLKGMSEGLFGENYLKAGGQMLTEALARTGDGLSRGLGGSGIEVQTPAEREDTLRKAEEEALQRIANKEAEIWRIEQMRIDGAKEGAELAAIEASYIERIQAANTNRNGKLAEELTAQKDSTLAAAQKLQAEERSLRTTRTKNAEEAARNAKLAVTSSTEDEQRRVNTFNVDTADRELYDAKLSERNHPESQTLAAERYIAEKKVAQVQEENAKWERDLARSKFDSLSATEAEAKSLSETLSGRRQHAEYIEATAKNQKEIRDALRAGNTELANMLTRAGSLRNALNFRVSSLVDPNGNPKNPGQIRAEQRAEQRAARRVQRAENRLRRNNYITGAKRDSNGRITGGYDVISGQRVSVDEEGNVFGLNPDGSRGDKVRDPVSGAQDPSARVGTSKSEWAKRFPQSDWAASPDSSKKEMEHASNRANLAMASQQAAISGAAESGSTSNETNGIALTLTRIERTLDAWNK